MAVAYHWLLLLSSAIISVLLIALLVLVPTAYHVFAIAGFPVIIFWLSWQLSKGLKAFFDIFSRRIDPKGKAVLVTGGSSGFGFEVAVRLDALGFRVIACCRNVEAAGVKKLKEQCSDRLLVIRMDVSNDDSVNQVKEQFGEMLAGDKLWAVVNNAGIGAYHGIEWGAGMKLYTDCFETNTLGAIRVTRAFLPFLRKTPDSRLVFVTSVEDRIAPLNQPGYAATKFAVRAFADCCRRELRDKDVRVAMVAPAFFATELSRRSSLISMLQKNWNDSPAEVRASYGQSAYDLFLEFTEGIFAIRHKDISPVAQALVNAVSKSNQPWDHTRVCGLMESTVYWVSDLMPEELVDVANTNSLVIPLLKFIKFLGNVTSCNRVQDIDE